MQMTTVPLHNPDRETNDETQELIAGLKSFGQGGR
jgi:hypothetical protein